VRVLCGGSSALSPTCSPTTPTPRPRSRRRSPPSALPAPAASPGMCLIPAHVGRLGARACRPAAGRAPSHSPLRDVTQHTEHTEHFLQAANEWPTKHWGRFRRSLRRARATGRNDCEEEKLQPGALHWMRARTRAWYRSLTFFARLPARFVPCRVLVGLIPQRDQHQRHGPDVLVNFVQIGDRGQSHGGTPPIRFDAAARLRLLRGFRW
jgi:hypothetical protein